MADLVQSGDIAVRAGTLIRDYMKGAEDAVTRRRVVWANLRSRGRIKNNCGGDGFQWQVQFRRADTQQNDGTGSVTPQPVDRYRPCFLDYQGLLNHDRITKREQLKGRQTKSRLIEVFGNMANNLVSDLEEGSSEVIWLDSTSNPQNLSGFQTFTGYTQTIDITDTTGTSARTANAADPFAYPSATYATRSTQLGALGGSSSSDGPWPLYNSSPEFDYFTPVIVRAQSTYFTGSTWAANAVEATRLALITNKRNKLPRIRGYADTVMMSIEMFYQYANNLDSKERVQVSSTIPGPESRKYGVDQEEGFRQDGALVTWEIGVPNNKAFLFNWNAIQLCNMQDRLFVVDPDCPKWHGESRSWMCIADFLAQWKFYSPRGFAMIDNSY